MKITEAIEVLGIFGSANVRVQGEKVIASCPFSRWNHEGGRDDSPSFAIWRARGGWRFNCLACGERGSMRRLFWRYLSMSGEASPRANFLIYAPWSEAEEEKRPCSTMDYRAGGHVAGACADRELPALGSSHGEGKQEHLWGMEKTENSVPPPEEMLSRFREALHPYWTEVRGMQRASWFRWDVRFNEVSRRIVFPCRDHEQRLVGWTQRMVWDHEHCFRCGAIIKDAKRSKAKGSMVHVPRCKCGQMYVKYQHWSGKWRNNVVYGESFFDGRAPVVVTEGPMDAIRLWDCGVTNPCCIFGAEMGKGQAASILRHTDKVVLIGDGDKAGRRMMDSAEALLGGASVQKITLPEGMDPGDMDSKMAREVLHEECFRRK